MSLSEYILALLVSPFMSMYARLCTWAFEHVAGTCGLPMYLLKDFGQELGRLYHDGADMAALLGMMRDWQAGDD